MFFSEGTNDQKRYFEINKINILKIETPVQRKKNNNNKKKKKKKKYVFKMQNHTCRQF